MSRVRYILWEIYARYEKRWPTVCNSFYSLSQLLTIIMQNPAKTNYIVRCFWRNSFHLTRKKQDSLHIVALTKVFELWSLRLWIIVAVLKVSKFRKQIMVSKLLPKNKPNSLSWKITTSRLIQKESMFFLQEDRLSFVLTLK